MKGNVKLAKSLLKIAGELASSRRTMDFYGLVRFLDENGWAFHNDYAVRDKDGNTGTRYELSEYPQNLDHVRPTDRKEMAAKLEELQEDYGNVVFSEGRHRYAPELKCLSVVLLD